MLLIGIGDSIFDGFIYGVIFKRLMLFGILTQIKRKIHLKACFDTIQHANA